MNTWIVGGVVVLWAAVVLPRLLRARGVSVNVLKQKLAAGATVVDVRTPDEFRGGAYPGAVNIPLQSLTARLSEIPKDRPVVLYCASGMRSASAAAVLQRAGYGDVVNAGGLSQMPR